MRSLWQVAVKGHAIPIPVGGENAQQPVFDPTGNRIVYERLTVTDALTLLPLCKNQPCDASSARRLAYSRQVARNPSWSPDGKQIAFESSEHGNVQVWRCAADGSNPTVVSSFDSPLSGTPRWSPDGSSIVLDSSVAGHSKIFQVNISRSQTTQLTQGDWEDVTPSFSHDGKFVYFASNRTGQFQVWKLAVASGTTSQVTRHGGFYAVESPDGKQLFYAKGIHRTEIATVPVEGGPETLVMRSLSYWPNFALNPTGIYFVPAEPVKERGAKQGVPILFHRFSDNKDIPVTTVPGIDMQGIALAPSGRELLLSLRTSADTNLMALSFARPQK